MINYDRYHKVNYSIESTPSGCSKDIFISSTDSNIRADIPFEYIYHIKIWGQLRSHKDLPLSGIRVRLLQINLTHHFPTCLMVGEVLTNANGFYLFDLPNQSLSCYQLIIHSSNPLNNQILSPDLNFSTTQDHLSPSYLKPLMDYLDKYFPNTYNHTHLMECSQDSSLVTTIYAIPCYR